MPRPTINDLVLAAGVSLATVDRVLNARAGVRQSTIDRVNQAIDRIGYVRDPFAANLARRRDFRAIIVVPQDEGQFLAEVRATLKSTANAALSDRVVLHAETFHRPDAHGLAALLDGLDAGEVDGVAVMAPETPPLRDAVRRLRERGIPMVAIVSDLPNSDRDHFIGINSIAAGRTAASLMGRFVGAGPAKIAVFTGSLQTRDSLDRRLGFDQVMSETFAAIEVLPTVEGYDDPNALALAFSRIWAAHPDLAGVYSMGGGNSVLVRMLADAAFARRPYFIAHELTPSTRLGLTSGVIDAVITQDLGHILRSAIRMLRAGRDARPIVPEQERIRIEILVKDNLV